MIAGEGEELLSVCGSAFTFRGLENTAAGPELLCQYFSSVYCVKYRPKVSASEHESNTRCSLVCEIDNCSPCVNC